MMSGRRQKNLKLSEKGIELLRSLAFFSRFTESDTVHQALVTGASLMAVQNLRKANAANEEDEDQLELVSAKYIAKMLEAYDPEHQWKVLKNQTSNLWELLRAPVNPSSPEALTRRIRCLIGAGKRKGSLTYSEVAEALIGLELGAEQMDQVYEALVDSGVDVVAQSPHTPEDWDGILWEAWPWAGATTTRL